MAHYSQALAQMPSAWTSTFRQFNMILIAWHRKRTHAVTENMLHAIKLSNQFWLRARQCGIRPGQFILSASILRQTMDLFEKQRVLPEELTSAARMQPRYAFRHRYRISTSAFGIGQEEGSSRTPFGLHCIAQKIGGGWPIGIVFKGRRPAGFIWEGQPTASIVHRILWLEGLEPGYNRGGKVDSFRRYIYIHGFSDETTLGRPCSHGCIHMAANDLLPLFERLPIGTLVWISWK